ncbi:MAG: hypothetical protein O2807_11875 [bacterium]|nr:hypothetical protein [bacterium]
MRGLIAAPDHPLLQGIDPRSAYAERGLFSEAFAEQYACAAARWLLENAAEDLLSPGAIVFAWDPRDTDGRFAGACLRGLLRAGAHVISAGIFPTPAAAAYLSAAGAAGALMLTASHNPADQNGIKIFRGASARKPLPEEDAQISRRVWDLSPDDFLDDFEAGVCTDTAAEARAVYMGYMTQLPNSWLLAGELASWSIVLDPARGAWSALAAEVIAGIGVGTLRELNALGAGPVNEGGGVIALEGRHVVRGDEEAVYRAHAGLAALFEAGRARRAALQSGEGFAAAGVFDADGDRAYALFYDPFADAVRILGGDDALVLQSEFLAEEKELPEGGIAVLTIESDAGAAQALSKLGLEVRFVPVGDKWILRAAERWGDAFALGGEESGHTVVPGLSPDALGVTRRFAAGDGLKSFLNTCAAVKGLADRLPLPEVYARLEQPFPRGYKKILYAYHVDRGRFGPHEAAWDAAGKAMAEAAEKALPRGTAFRWTALEDDPAVLYLQIEDPQKGEIGVVYVRNSGTERKIGASLRGPRAWSSALDSIGGAAIRCLLPRMKDGDLPEARAERAALESLRRAPAGRDELMKMIEEDQEARFGAPVGAGRILKEGIRGGLIEEAGKSLHLSALGAWYLEKGSSP